MTRIIAGRGGGRRLSVPAGTATRPTSDRVREALFSRLDHEGRLAGARVLDLYAGSGALGLEAASRGARAVVLVEAAAAAVRACRRNVSDLGLAGVVVRAGKVGAVLAAGPVGAVGAAGDERDDPDASGRYDLVFLDPPYSLTEQALGDDLASLDAGGWLAADALVVVERASRSPEPTWPPAWVPTDRRSYGESSLWFAEAPAP